MPLTSRRPNVPLLIVIGVVFLATFATIYLTDRTVSDRATDTQVVVQQQAELLRNQQSTHDTQVCVLSLIHDITPAKGETDDERRARYEHFFDEQTLKAKCHLTDDDIARVKAS